MLASGENSKLGFVDLQALNVRLESFLRSVLAAAVNGDADSTSLILGNTDSLELRRGESTAIADAQLIANCRAANLGAKKPRDRARESLRGLLSASLTTALLSLGLIEPSSNTKFPVLVEVCVGNLLVVLDRKSTRLNSSH